MLILLQISVCHSVHACLSAVLQMICMQPRARFGPINLQTVPGPDPKVTCLHTTKEHDETSAREEKTNNEIMNIEERKKNN